MSTRFSRRPPVRVCPALTGVLTGEQYHLSIDSHCRLLVARRTNAPFAKLEDVQSCFRQIELALSAVTRSQYSLLVDTRGGPARNDPAFETTMLHYRGKLLFGFAKNAALAMTATGRLQIQRYAKLDGRVVFVTDSPEAAFQYLGVANHVLYE
jgi:hypothetical protein